MLSWNQGDSSSDVATDFDANGNLQALQPGQALEWGTRNQLRSVMLVKREDGRHGIERYCYDSNGQRVRKNAVAARTFRPASTAVESCRPSSTS